MQNIRQLILGHFRLKAVSVVIATVIWLVSTGRDHTTQTVDVTLTIEPPREGVVLQVSLPSGDTQVTAPSMAVPGARTFVFTAELYGPQNKIETPAVQALTAQCSFPEIRTEDIPPNQVRTEKIPLRSLKVSGVQIGVEIRSTNPEWLEFKIDRLITKQLAVQDRLVYLDPVDRTIKPVENASDGCAEGYQVTRKTLRPRSAFVKGPQSILSTMDKIETESAPVSDLAPPRGVITTRLISQVEVPGSPYGRVPIECADDKIDITLEVDELVRTRPLKGVRIGVLRPEKSLYNVTILSVDGQKRDFGPDGPTVDFDVKGPGSLVGQLTAEDPGVRVFLDLMDVKALTTRPVEKPLTIILPNGIRMAGNPPRVEYEVKPAVTQLVPEGSEND